METLTTLKSDFEELPETKEKTLPEYFLARAKHYAELQSSPWLIDGVTGETRFFSKFNEETRQIASAFHTLGLKKGDSVIYMIRNLSTIPVLFTGVWRANGFMRASYPDDDEDTILSRVNENNAKFIVCEEDAVETCKNVAQNVNGELFIITVNHSQSAAYSIQQFLEDDDGSDCPELSISENDTALILCTSGTTGASKGAVHTHESFLFMLRNCEHLPFTLHKPNLISTKATHVSGASIGLILLATGKTGILISNITQENIFSAALKYKPGLVFAFTTFLMAMAGPEGKKYDFSSIEIILTGGMPVTPAIKETLKGLPSLQDIVVIYGLTEIMTVTTNAILTPAEQRETAAVRDAPDSSIGKPFPGVEVQFRDPETLEILGPNAEGELWAKSAGVFKHYHLNKAATDNAFVDGYLRTGDLGYYDSNGYIFVVDRLKDIFKYYNDHISPTELENIISKHPKVIEACVIGVADPGGHVPRAYVTIHPDNGTKNDISEEIKKFTNENLPSYKRLRGGVVIVDELPKGKTGKITRQLVAKLSVE